MKNTVQDVYKNFLLELYEIYEPEEKEKITLLVFEHVMNFKRIDLTLNKNQSVPEEKLKLFEEILCGLKTGRPVQYVLGRSWFCGLELVVNENVLIPRPETEELVNWIINDIHSDAIQPTEILDVCTGSGCIALALKKAFPMVKVYAIDNSEEALAVAKMNADKHNLEIEFIKMDALNMSTEIIPDIIVSNPPYVTISEKGSMHRRVTDFEPPGALFVEDSDPLIFYKSIASYGVSSFERNGKIYFEINERKGREILKLLSGLGYCDGILKKDLQEKERMIRAIKK